MMHGLAGPVSCCMMSTAIQRGIALLQSSAVFMCKKSCLQGGEGCKYSV